MVAPSLLSLTLTFGLCLKVQWISPDPTLSTHASKLIRFGPYIYSQLSGPL